jgi:hypothetical protein
VPANHHGASSIAFCRCASLFKKLVAYTVSEILLRFRRGSGPNQWGVGVTIFILPAGEPRNVSASQ